MSQPKGIHSGAEVIGKTHSAVVMVAKRAPLAIHRVDTLAPEPGEVLIRVRWTASTPLNLHQADGGLLVNHPQGMGGNFAGVIVQKGGDEGSSDKERLKVDDAVFGYEWRTEKGKTHQEYAVVPEFLVAKVCTGHKWRSPC